MKKDGRSDTVVPNVWKGDLQCPFCRKSTKTVFKLTHEEINRRRVGACGKCVKKLGLKRRKLSGGDKILHKG
jgi:hypothetical protein